MAIPKIRVSIINVVTKLKQLQVVVPCLKKTYERGQAKKSGLFKCSLQFQASGCYCMADLRSDKFSSSLSIKDGRIRVSRNRFETDFFEIRVNRQTVTSTPVYGNPKSKDFLKD